MNNFLVSYLFCGSRSRFKDSKICVKFGSGSAVLPYTTYISFSFSGSFQGSPRSSYARPPSTTTTSPSVTNGYHLPSSSHAYGEGEGRAAPPPYRPPPTDLQPPSLNRGSSYSSLTSYDNATMPVNPVLPSAAYNSRQQQQQARSSQSRQLPEVPRGRPEGEEGSYGAAPPLPTRRSAPATEDPHLGEVNLCGQSCTWYRYLSR